MSNHGFSPTSPALITDPYKALASRRPTKPDKTLGEAFLSSHTEHKPLFNEIEELFKRSIQSSDKALELLNDINQPFKKVKEDVFRLIQASKQIRNNALAKSLELNAAAEANLESSAKWLISNAKKSLLVIPDYLQEDKILEAAEDLNSLHQDNQVLGESSMPILQSLEIKEQYPNLRQRLDEVRSAKHNKKTQEILEFLETRTAAFDHEDSVLKKKDEYRYHLFTEQIARSSLFSGLPHDLVIDLMTEYLEIYTNNVFSQIPIVDTLAKDSKENSIEELKPSFHLFGHDVPLQTLDFVRHAALQNIPRFNRDGTETSFVTSLRNLDEAKNIYYGLEGAESFEREPHNFGLGAWSELRTGFALVKLQEEQEARYLTNMNNLDNVPYIITKVIPAITKPYYDKAGVDFWVKVVDRLDVSKNYYIPLQVKSSEFGLNSYKSSGFKHGGVNIIEGGRKGIKSISSLVNDLQGLLKTPHKMISEEEFRVMQDEFESAQQKPKQDHPDSETRILIHRLRRFLKR